MSDVEIRMRIVRFLDAEASPVMGEGFSFVDPGPIAKLLGIEEGELRSKHVKFLGNKGIVEIDPSDARQARLTHLGYDLFLDEELEKHLGEQEAVQTARPKAMIPSAFISYSWDDDGHKEWVKLLAERLRADGVDVTLDRWATVPGDQLPTFMERAIRENQFVVIICTPRYKRRSDAREGGVGYEGDIMTAEVMTQQNNRKFIPVWRSGTWIEAAPSWLASKYYINLTGDPYSERDYKDLVRTLLGIRESAPPLGERMSTVKPIPSPHTTVSNSSVGSGFEDIKITRVIVEEVTEPRNDGTRGCALYTVPFALSRRPPSEWAQIFVATWDHPPQWSTMHRPGIARVSGATVTLNGTTIEEVEQVHRDTLQLTLDETNRRYREWNDGQERLRTREQAEREERQKLIDETSKRIKFD